MAKWWDLDAEQKKQIASEVERQHELKGRNVVSLSAARCRRDWNRGARAWNGDDNAA